jgi:NADH-quinone oxidoreductase subunit M
MITTLLILIPLIGGLLAWASGSKSARYIALATSIATLGLAIYAIVNFDSSAGEQFSLSLPWIKAIGSNFHVGMDGISILLVALTAFLVPVILLSTKDERYSNPALFYGLALIMESALIGVFTAYDAFLFYLFWELALIPIYFICLLFGGEGRFKITLKFFAYTLAGSLLMLVGLVYLRSINPENSFEFSSLYKMALTNGQQSKLFWMFVAAFAIKMPIFPLHTWQPDTYTNAPAQGTMLLSGIMSKMGVYGLIRVIIPMFPNAVSEYGHLLIVLSIVGIIYGSLLAWVQTDFKRLIAYSSFAHIGLIAAGVFSNTQQGMDGAMVQMIAHGINAVGLFLIVDYVERTAGTRAISALGGIRTIAPAFATLFLLILLGSVGLPLTNGFVGEFLLLSGVFKFKASAALFAGLTMILGAVYMLHVYQKTMLGEEGTASKGFADVKGLDFYLLSVLAVLVFISGIFPNFLTHISGPAFELLMK